MDTVNNRVTNFKNSIINNFDDIDLVNFYNNIRTLKIKKSSNNSWRKLKSNTPSLYNYAKNIIIINKHKLDDYCLNHELFHLASNGSYNNKVVVGFYIFYQNKHLGRGLNEGYTELLTRRYFKKNNDKYSYDFEMTVAKSIEDIIGVKKMQSLYLRADLLNLVKTLSQYLDRDYVIKFMEDVDYVHYCFFKNDYQREVITKVYNINKFIILLKIKKYYDNNHNISIKNLKVNYDIDSLNIFNIIQDEFFFNELLLDLNSNKKQKGL